MEWKKFIENKLDEGIFDNKKSQEELVAKSLIKILKDKAKEHDLDHKKILDYMVSKI
jgi:hypothetical protein